MIQRIYEMEDLTEAAETLRKGPPWWLHTILFGLIALLLGAGAVVSRSMAKKVSGQPQSRTPTIQRPSS
ncbi:MAG: hypothetical protein AB7U82_26175 [Blastocatellales bacterium]